MRFLHALFLASAFGAAVTGARASADAADAGTVTPDARSGQAKSGARVHGRQVGTASFYADRFVGQTMANGKPMDPEDDNAASRTLPLGTKARVTNLENGRSAVVTIEDRGPYVDGRIVDLSPASARQIGLAREQGLATVEVTPLQLPPGGAKASGGQVGPAR